MSNTITKAELKEQGWTLFTDSIPTGTPTHTVHVCDNNGYYYVCEIRFIRLDIHIAWREIQEVVG